MPILTRDWSQTHWVSSPCHVPTNIFLQLTSTSCCSPMSGIFSFWNSQYTVDVRYPKESALVTAKEQHSTTSSVFLRDFVERRCPSLHAEFRPAWWLPKYANIVYCSPYPLFKFNLAVIFKLFIVSSVTFQREIRLCITGNYNQARRFSR